MDTNTADISAMARHLFDAHGARAIAEAARKAADSKESGEEEQAAFWRRVESALLEMRGPLQG